MYWLKLLKQKEFMTAAEKILISLTITRRLCARILATWGAWHLLTCHRNRIHTHAHTKHPNSPNDDIHHQTVAHQAHHKHHRVNGDYDGDDGWHRLRFRVPGAVRGVVEDVRQAGLPGEVRDALPRLAQGTAVLFENVHHAALHGAERWLSFFCCCWAQTHHPKTSESPN